MADTVVCTIERRLLVNYRIEPDLVAALLPTPFRPQLVSGGAVAGVCFIRLGALRLPGMPEALGFSTENVAHRFAVEWDDAEGTHVGVYVPRRDTDSRLTAWGGGRVFPGHHGLARFDVHEQGPELRIAVASHDGVVGLAVTAREATHLGGSLFGSTDDAVEFFRRGCSGYSPQARSGSDLLDGVRLVSDRWDARPVSVEHMTSSLFDDETLFPRRTCVIDSGLVMRDLPVRWRRDGVLRSPVSVS